MPCLSAIWLQFHIQWSHGFFQVFFWSVCWWLLFLFWKCRTTIRPHHQDGGPRCKIHGGSSRMILGGCWYRLRNPHLHHPKCIPLEQSNHCRGGCCRRCPICHPDDHQALMDRGNRRDPFSYVNVRVTMGTVNCSMIRDEVSCVCWELWKCRRGQTIAGSHEFPFHNMKCHVSWLLPMLKTGWWVDVPRRTQSEWFRMNLVSTTDWNFR